MDRHSCIYATINTSWSITFIYLVQLHANKKESTSNLLLVDFNKSRCHPLRNVSFSFIPYAKYGWCCDDKFGSVFLTVAHKMWERTSYLQMKRKYNPILMDSAFPCDNHTNYGSKLTSKSITLLFSRSSQYIVFNNSTTTTAAIIT